MPQKNNFVDSKRLLNPTFVCLFDWAYWLYKLIVKIFYLKYTSREYFNILNWDIVIIIVYVNCALSYKSAL